MFFIFLHRTQNFVWEKRLLLALVVISVLYLAAINPALYTWGDNAHYIIVGRAIATGQGLKDIHYPGSPPFTYPIPMFPLMLAPVILVFGYSLLPMKILVAVMGVAAVYLVYRLLRNLMDEDQAILLMVLAGVSPQLVSFSHQVMSEIPHLAFSLISLLCLQKYGSEGGWITKAGLLGAVMIAVTSLTRSMGIAIVLASIPYILWQSPSDRAQRLRKVGLLIVVSATVWVLFNHSILTEIPYMREFLRESPYSASSVGQAGPKEFVERIVANLNAYRIVVPETILYLTYNVPLIVLSTLLLVPLGYGFFHSLLTRRTILEFYVLFYSAILLLYEPSNYGNVRRYLVPIIPFILYYFMRGCARLALWISNFGRVPDYDSVVEGARAVLRPGLRSALSMSTAVICILILLNLTSTVQASVLKTQPEMFDYYVYDSWEEYKDMAVWTKAHTPPESTVLTRMIYFYHFWSHRTVDWYPYVDPQADSEQIARTILAANADYIVVDSLKIDRTAAHQSIVYAVQQSPGAFQLVYHDGDNRVYRILPDARLSQGQQPLVTQEIRYQLVGAGKVFLVWGINGWTAVPEETWPAGTAIKDAIMHTPMDRQDDTFVTELQVPLGATIDYVFYIAETSNGADIEVWDTNGKPKQDYHTVAMQGGIAEIEATLSLAQDPAEDYQ